MPGTSFHRFFTNSRYHTLQHGGDMRGYDGPTDTFHRSRVKASQSRAFLMAVTVPMSFLVAHIPGEKDLTDLTHLQQATVQIRAYSSSGKSVKQGTGFFVTGEGDLVTNWHVLDGVHHAEVQTYNGRVYDIRHILAEDREKDLVMVNVETDGYVVPFVPIDRGPVHQGDSILVIACTCKQGRTVYRGAIIDNREALPYGAVVHMTIPVHPGASGSPVVNMAGELIGVATYRCVIDGMWSYFAIPASAIVDLEVHEGLEFYEWHAGNRGDDFFKAAGLYRRSLEYASRGIYTTALQYLEQAISLEPGCAELYTQTGICHEQLGCYEQAIAAFRKAIALQSDCSEAYCGLAVALCMSGDYAEGARAFEQVLRLKPSYTDTYYNLGVTYNDLEEYRDAVRILRRLVDLRPDFVEAYCELSMAYVSLGDYDNALDVLTQAQDIEPVNPHVQYGMGMAYTNLRRFDEAIEALCSVTATEPGWAQAHFLLGINYGFIGEHDNEIRCYTKAIQLKPDFADAYFNLALAYAARGNQKVAIDQCTSLERIDPERAAHLLQIIESAAQE